MVLAYILLALCFVSSHPVRPAASFLLDLEQGFDVVSKQTLTRFRKVLDLIDVLDLVPQGHGFLELGCTPGSHTESQSIEL